MNHDLALTMLHRFTRGWTVVDAGTIVWWRPPTGGFPPMQFNDEETALWEALRKDRA